MRKLVIDGSTTPDIHTSVAYAYGSNAPYAPFNVFDPETQTILASVHWLWLARVIKWWHGGGY